MPTCLVIDDEPLIAKRMAEAIGELLRDWTVIRETDPARGMARIDADKATREIGLIVVDLGMPGLSGQELIERTLAEREDLRGRIVVCTGWVGAFEGSERLLGELGCLRLDKPASREEREAVIRMAVADTPNG